MITLANQVETILPREVEQMLKTNETVHIIDVREDEEVAVGKIPQSMHIKLSTLPERYEELDKDKEYIMVCRSGRRSYAASEYLADLGYKVKNMDGGMLKWQGIIK